MHSPSTPLFVPLGDEALLIRFGDSLSEAANRAAIAAARRIEAARVQGVLEVTPMLVSVLVRYDPRRLGLDVLSGEMRLALGAADVAEGPSGARQTIGIAFDGEDLDEVAQRLGLTVAAFVAAHNAGPLRVLSTGFSPGFLYCGFHPEALRLPRRDRVRRRVEPGTVLFAAGQTAITSTAIPTGWHVIGRTGFRNFDAARMPPVFVNTGDVVAFEAVQ